MAKKLAKIDIKSAEETMVKKLIFGNGEGFLKDFIKKIDKKKMNTKSTDEIIDGFLKDLE